MVFTEKEVLEEMPLQNREDPGSDRRQLEHPGCGRRRKLLPHPCWYQEVRMVKIEGHSGSRRGKRPIRDGHDDVRSESCHRGGDHPLEWVYPPK